LTEYRHVTDRQTDRHLATAIVPTMHTRRAVKIRLVCVPASCMMHMRDLLVIAKFLVCHSDVDFDPIWSKI